MYLGAIRVSPDKWNNNMLSKLHVNYVTETCLFQL